jgi:ABC-2 type transport system ATP-binding protein
LEYFAVLRQMPRKAAKSRARSLLEAFDLTDKQHVPVQKLSRGMQQKLAIAVALIHQPQLLLLDEPTLGLDVESGEMVKKIVRQVADSGCAILLTTHQLNVAEALSDRVAVIRQGQIIAEQPTQELIRRFSSAAYHIEFEGALAAEQKSAIVALGASVEGQQICYSPSPSAAKSESSAVLYQVLNHLAPLPLVAVRQDRADLTDIFLQLIAHD